MRRFRTSPKFLEEHGIKVIFLPLPEAVSGATCLVGVRTDPAPVIVVNAILQSRTASLSRSFTSLDIG